MISGEKGSFNESKENLTNKPDKIIHLLLFGSLGGIATNIITLVSADYDGLLFTIEAGNVPFIIGYSIRILTFALLGAAWIIMNRSVVSSILVAFQLGMVPSFMLAILLASPAQNQVEFKHASIERPVGQAAITYVAASASPLKAADPIDSARADALRGLGLGPSPDAFRLVFGCVLGLTLFSAVISVYLASRGADTQRINSLIETYSTTWKLGFGAIIGLISGKAFG